MTSLIVYVLVNIYIFSRRYTEVSCTLCTGIVFSTTDGPSFLILLRSRGSTWTELKSHLSALRHHCIRHNIPHSLHSPRLHLLLKGLARCSTKTPTSAAAVSTKHLRSLARVSKALHSSKDHCQLMAMMAVAFYGFLRPSEYCVTPSAHYLKWNDVQFSNKERFVRLTLRS